MDGWAVTCMPVRSRQFCQRRIFRPRQRQQHCNSVTTTAFGSCTINLTAARLVICSITSCGDGVDGVYSDDLMPPW